MTTAGVPTDVLRSDGLKTINGTSIVGSGDLVISGGGGGANTILYGTAAPTTEGVNGDWYIRTSTNVIYGPKAAGTWPAGTSLIGPAGANGTNGTNGTSGTNGNTILYGTADRKSVV